MIFLNMYIVLYTKFLIRLKYIYLCLVAAAAASGAAAASAAGAAGAGAAFGFVTMTTMNFFSSILYFVKGSSST